MRRRPLILALFGLAALAGAYTAWWFALARTFRQDIDDWVALNRARGYAIGFGATPIGGFPFAVETRFLEPAIAAGDGSWRWQGPELRLQILPWAPYDLQFTAPGRHRLALGGDEQRQVEIRGERISLDLHLKDGVAPDRFGLSLAGIGIEDSRAGRAFIEKLAAEAEIPASPGADPARSSLDLLAHATVLRLPDGMGAPLGPEIHGLHVAATVKGRVPAGAPRRALAAWSAAGGDVEARHLELWWDGVWVKGDGTLALDESMQPLFAGSFVVANLGRALDRLAAAGSLQAGAARMAKLTFAALAQVPPGGGLPEVRLPLTIQDGWLYMGPIKLAALRPLDWSWLP